MTQKSEPIANKPTLSDAKKALLLKRLQGKRKAGKAAASISKRPSSDTPPPASFAQERLWFMHQFNSQNPAYNMHEAIHLHGDLNTTTLQAAINAVVARHGVLRTSFAHQDEQLVQIVAPSLTIPLEIIDLTHFANDEQEAAAKQTAVSVARHVFDLTQPPLLRTVLICRGDLHHTLLITTHHIISDEFSNGIFWQELNLAYKAFHNDQPLQLPDLPIQYGDYAHWQKTELNQPTLQKQQAYWLKQLGGKLPLLQLPTDRPRPATQTQRGQWAARTLSADLVTAVSRFSRQQAVTPFMTLLAVFKILLFRYTNQTDLLVGTPLANRILTETQSAIGFYLNTVVLRTDVSGQLTFEQLVQRVGQTTSAAFAQQAYPFEKLVEQLQPVRDPSYNPVFQVMFTYKTETGGTTQLGDLQLERQPVDSGTSKFDLTLFVVESADGLEVAFEYAEDLFDQSSVERMLHQFETLLTVALANPNQSLSRLPILPKHEHRLLLKTFNQTAAPFSQKMLIHQLIEAVAKKRPSSTAIQFADESISYETLNQRANQLARHLRQLGVGPETLVALCPQHPPHMLLGMLAVLKAGGAYTPLDPTYPPERLAYMLHDSETAVLITETAVNLPQHAAKTVLLDVEQTTIDQQPNHNLNLPIDPDNLAYLIYTSGSTGRPKGVQVSHRNLVHSTQARLNYYDPISSFLLLSSFSFDSSVVGIYGTLCQGGTLHLPPPQFERGISETIRLIERHQLSHLLSLPSLFALMLDVAKPEQLGSLRAVIVAGEACPIELAHQHYALLPQTALYNEYGPTEGTVWSSVYELPQQLQATQVPIGRPIANMQAYVLDAQLQPQPISVPGELFIGGEGITRGYLKRPSLTAERFIPNPFREAGAPADRLYRTGDLVRWLPSGNLEFLGRVDHQIKIRGFRIEIGEIENVLSRHPAVKETVVTVQETKNGDKQLIGYATVTDETLISTDLRSHVGKTLPDYMVPAAMVMLDKMPRTPNGKIDRKQLPLPESLGSSQAPFAPPATPTEEKVAAIWQNLLKAPQVGRHDNFFDLGGHSLLALRLLTRIEDELETNLPLATFFDGATVEYLARQIDQQGGKTAWSSLVPIRADGSETPFFCVHGITGDIWWFRDLAERLDSNRPMYALRPKGIDGVQEPIEDIREMAAYYVQEIRTIQPKGPYLLGGFSLGGTVAYEMANLLQAAGEQIGLLAMFDHAPYDPTIYHAAKNRTNGRVKTAVKMATNLPRWISTQMEGGTANFISNVGRKMRMRLKANGNQSDDRQPTAADMLSNADQMTPIRLQLTELHYQAVMRFHPRPYQGDVVLFKAQIRPLVDTYDPEVGWGALCHGKLTVETIPGAHEFMFHEPNVATLANRVQAHIKKSERPLKN